MTTEEQLDEIFDLHPLTDLPDSSWTISLGTATWTKPFVMLCVFEKLTSGGLGWVNFGRIDVFRRGTDLVNMLISTKESSTLVSLDVERFSGSAATSCLENDLDGIISEMKNLALDNQYHGCSQNCRVHCN